MRAPLPAPYPVPAPTAAPAPAPTAAPVTVPHAVRVSVSIRQAITHAISRFVMTSLLSSWYSRLKRPASRSTQSPPGTGGRPSLATPDDVDVRPYVRRRARSHIRLHPEVSIICFDTPLPCAKGSP